MRRETTTHRQRSFASRCMLALALSLLAPSSAVAQYALDAGDEAEEGDIIRYFGSVKDSTGTRIQGATILITNKSASYVFVTDDLGRFRGHLPSDALANKVAVKCFKAEFASLSVTKRAGPRGARPSVQVDCVLGATPGTAAPGA